MTDSLPKLDKYEYLKPDKEGMGADTFHTVAQVKNRDAAIVDRLKSILKDNINSTVTDEDLEELIAELEEQE
jgi:hypothetical protein